jgi:hypothetical protein
MTIFVFICKTDYSKTVKQEVNSAVILPPFSIPWQMIYIKIKLKGDYEFLGWRHNTQVLLVVIDPYLKVDN